MNTDINDAGSEWIILSNNNKYEVLIIIERLECPKNSETLLTT